MGKQEMNNLFLSLCLARRRGRQTFQTLLSAHPILCCEKGKKTGLLRLFFTSLAIRKVDKKSIIQTLLSVLLLSFEKGNKERQDF
jgi:hypothetical protein